jgi:zinc transport system substrate-binding protein
MMKRTMIKILALFSFLILLGACEEQVPGGPVQGDHAAKPRVLTSNYPLYYFASEIAGDVVDVQMPDIDGDPAMWVPGASDLPQLQTADLIVINGAGYESWLAFTSLDAKRLLDTTEDIQDLLLPIENATLHQHGPEGEHSHEGTAFTTWLNPQIAIEQSRAIARGLSALVPEQAEVFKARLLLLEKRLDDLDRSFAKAFSQLKDQPLVFSHPVYQYLQQRYGLNGLSVHWEPDKDPGVKDWVDFQNMLRGHPAKLIIWEGQPSPVTLERLQDQGIQSVVFDPVANQPASSDYFAVMSANLNRISGN